MPKNYVIIGGSSGIGKSLVDHLESAGHSVCATFLSNPMSSRNRISYQKFDVLQDDLNLDFIPDEIHGLAYCPGTINLKSFKRFKEEELLEDFKLQVIGATKVIRQLLPRMNQSDAASIVLFSTVAVQQGFNFHSQVAMSKGAIEGLTRALAAEFAPKIRVNAIAPSLTDTPLAGKLLNTEQKMDLQAQKNPLKKVGSPEDIAKAASFLLSDDSSWITGQVIHVDGGFSTIK